MSIVRSLVTVVGCPDFMEALVIIVEEALEVEDLPATLTGEVICQGLQLV